MTAEQVFGEGQGRTFDDLNVLPAFTSAGGKAELSVTLAPGFDLKLPLLTAPMDTVTEAIMAIQMALRGGLGMIHYNMPPWKEAGEVEKVKRHQMGIIEEPVCRCPGDPISEVYKIRKRFGFSTVLITEDGTRFSRLLGMVTKGHVALENDTEVSLGKVMTPVNKLAVRPRASVSSIEEARAALREERITSKLVLLNEDGSVGGLVTVTDVRKMDSQPDALLDARTCQLRVGAAVSTRDDDVERVKALVDAGVDVLVVDTAQGGTDYAVKRIGQIKEVKPGLPVIAGNVVTPHQAEPLVEAGASALRVGMGSGSICSTQEVLGIGSAQLSAVYRVARFVRDRGLAIPVIADGGVRTTGDMFKALACGASAVMVGRFVAGCDESPAEETTVAGRTYKKYRGMGSLEAMKAGGKYRYATGLADTGDFVEQGVAGLVPAVGPLERTVSQVSQTLRLGLEYLGCFSIGELHRKVDEGAILFELRSQAAKLEGTPHDIFTGIT